MGCQKAKFLDFDTLCVKAQQQGAVTLLHLCESCNEDQPFFGLSEEGKKRWCAKCAKQQNGAVTLQHLCETCNEVQPSFGLP